jgi:hypothetical protein
MNTMLRCAPGACVGAPSSAFVALAGILLGTLLGALTPGSAHAQLPRQFPAQALRGDLTVLQPPEVKLNDTAARLSPGARIRGANNMLQMSGALVGQKLRVHYTLDGSGNVHDVWVLTPEEARREPWPKTPAEAARWSFDGSAQTWTRR